MLATLDQRAIVAVASAFVLAFAITPYVRRLALRLNVLDRPAAAPDRKVHQQPTPLLGGFAIFTTFFVVVFGIVTLFPDLLNSLPMKALTGLFLGSVILMIGGALDDIRPRSPGRQIYWPLLAAFTAVASGVGVSFISNPFGGVIWLDRVQWGPVTLWADAFTILWLMGMMYTTKLLDGLDGLVSGVTAIGGLIVAIVSLRPEVDQPTTALLALILSASCLGFLRWNWNPARIFLGEGGSLLTGFLLGSLAIISGGKIATALLIMGLPILDVVWVMMRRAIVEKQSPFRTADRKHLHFRLLDLGLSQRQTVLLLYLITALFGSATLFVHGLTKLIVLLLLVILMFGLGLFLSLKQRRQEG
jgi:UDP-GlcNAc:undecaprenyl-phosphate GlcNAc-1-phosphate transferase